MNRSVFWQCPRAARSALLCAAIVVLPTFSAFAQSDSPPEASAPSVADVPAPSATPSPSADESIAPAEYTTVVTATRVAEDPRFVGASITVITAEQIEARQLRTVGEVLRAVPGVDIVRTGGPGATMSAFLRGANPGETLVLVDGVDVSDPSDASAGSELANLGTEEIERIEVLRGPASTLYGSSAMGGVIQIITRRGTGPLSARASVGGGSFRTLEGSASVRGGDATADYALGASYLGVGTAGDVSAGGPVPAVNPYQRVVISGRTNLLAARPFEAGLMLRYTDSTLGLNGYDYMAGRPVADPNFTQHARQLLVAPSVHHELFDGRWVQDLTGSFSWSSKIFHDRPNTADEPDDPDNYTGRRLAAEWKHSLTLAEGNQMLALLAARRDSATTSSLQRASARTLSAALQDEQRLLGSLTLRAGGRVDHHQVFGAAFTYGLAASQEIPALRTIVRASVGSGFLAPTLYQLNDPTYGNKELEPETSRSFEVGFEQPLPWQRLTFGAAFFSSRIQNLFSFEPAPSFRAINVGRADLLGIESFVALELGEASLRVDYTWTLPRDPAKGQDLIRRPRHKGSAWVDLRAPGDLTVSAGARYVGIRHDNDFSQFPPPQVALHSYVVASLAASRPLAGGVSLSARVENLFGARYEEALGYPAPGFGAFAALKVER